MKKQNVETIVLKNAKTGVAEKIQHECHNSWSTATKHFWKADAKFFELTFKRFLLRKARCWHTSCRKHSRRKINSLGRTKR